MSDWRDGRVSIGAAPLGSVSMVKDGGEGARPPGGRREKERSEAEKKASRENQIWLRSPRGGAFPASCWLTWEFLRLKWFQTWHNRPTGAYWIHSIPPPHHPPARLHRSPPPARSVSSSFISLSHSPPTAAAPRRRLISAGVSAPYSPFNLASPPGVSRPHPVPPPAAPRPPLLLLLFSSVHRCNPQQKVRPLPERRRPTQG